MSAQTRLVLRTIAILTLIVSIVWMILRPGFDALVTLLGSISGVVTLIASDKSSASPNTIASNTSPGSVSSARTGQQSPEPPIYPPSLSTPTQSVINPSTSNTNPDWVPIAALIYYGTAAIVGFIMSVHNGAIAGILGAGAGVVVAGYVAWILINVAAFLWVTRLFWLVVGVLLAIGYFISGKF